MRGRDGTEKSRDDAAIRMRKWRERQRQRLGGLVQVVVWVRAEQESALRTVFEKLADPDWIGESYRAAVAPWLSRNRPPARAYEGLETSSEVDRPMLDDGARLLPIGGRVFGTGGTMVELTPSEAWDLDERIKAALEEVHKSFIRDRDFADRIRDTTGVIVQEQAAYLRGTSKLMREYDVDRPVGEEQFWANERTIAGSVLSLTEGVVEDRGEGCFIYGFSGLHRFPSRCLVVTSLQHSEFQTSPDQPLVALVKLDHGGTPPTNCFERLATELRRELLPQTPADAIMWYDAGRDGLASSQALQITRVKLEYSKQSYREAVWLHDDARNHAFFRFVRQRLTDLETRELSSGTQAEFDDFRP